jgi:F-type H+-transporting ATPase subunit epsilon
MPQKRMNLKVLLPFQVYADKAGVSRILVETRDGSLGLLPNRLDCVVAIVPGILVYESDADGEVMVAVDEGVLVKAGGIGLVSVRQAIGGAELGRLREAVDREFKTLEEYEKSMLVVMTKLETGVLRRFANLKHE